MIRRETLSKVWPHKPLGEVVDFLDSRRRPVSERERNPGPYPYFGANGQQGTIDGYLFDEPLILLAEDGGFFGQPGKTIAYQVEGKCWVNNHAHVLRPKNGYNIRFLCRQLEHYDVSPFVSGTTRAKLNKGQAEKIPVLAPPLEEQKRIAAILDKADGIRRKRQQAMAMADEFLRSVFLDMFGDPVTNPKGFPIGVIGDIVENVRYGTSKKAHESQGEFPILRMGNITYDGKIDTTDLKYINLDKKEQSKFMVSKGDIVFNRTNSSDLVGKTAVFDLERRMAIAGYLIKSTAKKDVSPYYVSGYLNSKHGKLTLKSICKSIVGMANINAKEYQAIKVLIPDPDVQKRYERLVKQVQSRLSTQKNFLTEAEIQFQSISQLAFGGEL